jgi:nicotinate-nucleotide adenylyltransferase
VIGILGGTFDPPHIAHLALAQAAHEQLELDEVLFMPAGDPWQKSRDVITAADHRVAMTRLAASGAPYFVADDREILRRGPTYTIETVEELGQDCVLVLGAGPMNWLTG